MSASNLKKTILLWLLVGIVAFGIAWQLDDAVGHAWNAAKNPDLHALASACSKLGEGEVVAGVAILASAIFFFQRRPKVAADIFFIGLASLTAGLTATIFRVLIGRTRPNNHDFPQGIYGVWHDGHWIIGKFAFSSLPSGHAAVAVGVAAAAWLVHRGWGAVFLVYALAVMWSRIALECHHLSDVTASTFLAIIVASLMKRFVAPQIDLRFKQEPKVFWFTKRN